MSIHMGKLLQQLAAADESHFEMPPISDYVRENILEPMRRGDEVLFANLDFTKFCESDVDAIEEWADARIRAKGRLTNINRVFCNADPATVKNRAFC